MVDTIVMVGQAKPASMMAEFAPHAPKSSITNMKAVAVAAVVVNKASFTIK